MFKSFRYVESLGAPMGLDNLHAYRKQGIMAMQLTRSFTDGRDDYGYFPRPLPAQSDTAYETDWIQPTHANHAIISQQVRTYSRSPPFPPGDWLSEQLRLSGWNRHNGLASSDSRTTVSNSLHLYVRIGFTKLA